MFTIHTAAPGAAYHKLHPTERLGYAVPSMGFDSELTVKVRVDYGLPDPFTFKFFLSDSCSGEEFEVITTEEEDARVVCAAEHGDDFDFESVHSVSPLSGLWKYCQKLEGHFRALMALNLFKLPVNL